MLKNSVRKRLLEFTEPAMQATTAAEFLVGIRYGFDRLYEHLIESRSPQTMLAALDEAFRPSAGSLRQRRILELCSWPIFDKPALPHPPERMLPEFLWLFCVPFVVKFSTQELARPCPIEAEPCDTSAMVGLVADSGWLNDQGVITGLSGLYTREDIHLRGPKSLASYVVRPQNEPRLSPRPLAFDPDIESGRVATLHFLATARLPMGEHELITKQSRWGCGPDLERLVAQALTHQGHDVEQVTSLPPTSMAEALFRCNPAGLLELQTVLELAKTHYPCRDIVLRHPMEGMVELMATLENEEEILLTPPFAFIEPRSAVQNSVRRLCSALGLTFRGAFSVAIKSASTFH